MKRTFSGWWGFPNTNVKNVERNRYDQSLRCPSFQVFLRDAIERRGPGWFCTICHVEEYMILFHHHLDFDCAAGCKPFGIMAVFVNPSWKLLGELSHL